MVDSSEIEACLSILASEMQELDVTDEAIETTLIMLPQGFEDFYDYLDLVDLAEALLVEQGYEGIYQLATFHPNYRFANAPVHDPANFTNRSPYPTLHLIREASIERVLEHYEDPEDIPERNIALAREKGYETFQKIMDSLKH